MEKPGIEPATPGLQGIALIPYATAASVSARFYLLTTNTGYEESTYSVEILIINGGFLHFISLGFIFKQRNLII